MRLFTLLLVNALLITLKTSAQNSTQYFPVEIFPNSAKVSPASKIFDECYVIGYNSKGQLLYSKVEASEAADHDGYSIILYDATTKKQKVLKGLAMEDSLNTYENFKDFFKTNQKLVKQFIVKYKIENKKPTVTSIAQKEYTMSQKCKETYDWYNCTYQATYQKEKPFTIKLEGVPSKDEKPTLYKLIQFNNYKIILYNKIQRGWEGTPYVVGYDLY